MSPTRVALLRAVNVGGRGRLAMADLREVVASIGHTDVSTYLQSGNVVFAPSGRDASAGPGALAAGIAAALVERLGAAPAVVVVSGQRLGEVVAGDPFAAEEDPTRKHVVFLAGPVDDAARDAVAAAQERSASRDSDDEAAVVGGALYLRTPGGMGRSELAARLARSGGPLAKDGSGTVRSWRTVLALADLTRAARG